MVPRVRGRRDRDYRHVIHHYSPSFNPCSFLHVHLIFKVESLGGDGSGKSSESVCYRSSGRRRRSRRRRRRQAQRDVEGRESREWIERESGEREEKPTERVHYGRDSSTLRLRKVFTEASVYFTMLASLGVRSACVSYRSLSAGGGPCSRGSV